MNLNHLQHFYRVASYKSYSKAAQELLVQQPALSKSVKNLEQDLGLILFKRIGRGIELTREGEYIYSHCAEIFSHVDQIENFGRDVDIPLKRSITVFCSDAVAAKMIPSSLGELGLKFPGIRPIITAGLANEMIAHLKEDRGSLGLFFHLPKLPSGLKIHTEIAIPFKLVISSKQYHSQRVRTSFIGSREVDDPSSMKFPTVEKMRKIWPETQIKLSSNSLVSHKEMVLQGLGVSILPLFLVEQEIQAGDLKCLLEKENFSFNLKVVVGTKVKLKDFELDLISLIENNFSSL